MISYFQDIKCVQQLRSYFSNLKKQSGSGTDQALSYISSIIDDPQKTVGLIINERYSNLPSEISVPSFTKLKLVIRKLKGFFIHVTQWRRNYCVWNRNEIETVSSKDVNYQFTHYIMVCRLYKMQTGSKKKAKNTDSAVTWCNLEDEIFDRVSTASVKCKQITCNLLN